MSALLRKSLLVLPLALAATACGGGPQHIGEITPAVRDQLSGAWKYNAEVSDDPAKALIPESRPEGRHRGDEGKDNDGDEGRPGGGAYPPGSGGAYPPEGGEMGRPGTGGRRGSMMGRGHHDAKGRHALHQMAVTIPTRMDLSLTDSLVTVTYAGQKPLALPFGEEVRRELSDSVTMVARADWDTGRLVVIRAVKDGGSITETYMPSVDGKRLTVDVEVEGLGPGGAEFQRVFNREARR
jgi:hypothetical protein